MRGWAMSSDQILLGDQWAIYGDGMMAQILTMIDYVDSDGKRKIRITVIPSKKMLAVYGLSTGEELNPHNGSYTKEYPYALVHPLINDTNIARILVETNVKGMPTGLSMRDQVYNVQIESQELLIRTLQVENARLHEQTRLMASNLKVFVKDVTELGREFKRIGYTTEEMMATEMQQTSSGFDQKTEL